VNAIDKDDAIATRQLQADTVQSTISLGTMCKSTGKRTIERDRQRRSDSDAPVAGRYSAVDDKLGDDV
jgi:hypothetical protein